jgi:hypothetical protein
MTIVVIFKVLFWTTMILGAVGCLINELARHGKL